MSRLALLVTWLGTLAVFGAEAVRGQEDVAPEHPPGVRITFLPPPIDGTLSLGLYDQQGKLVRTLKQEAEEKEFIVGLNGLIIHWDGVDDAGSPAPAGIYQARGYAVGDVDVEGLAFHGNDWLSAEDALRITRVVELALGAGGELLVKGVRPGSLEVAWLRYDSSKDALVPLGAEIAPVASLVQVVAPGEDIAATARAAAGGPRYYLQTGSLWRSEGGAVTPVKFAELGRVVAASEGREDTLWVIDETPEAGRAVKQFSREGELLRALPVDAGQPAPTQIVAERARDAIHLLEISPEANRVRSLVLDRVEAGAAEAEPAVSTWKTVLEKTIRSSSAPTDAAARGARPEPFTPEAKVNVRLVPNPLYQNQPASADVQVTATPRGTALQTTDGLHLKLLTETPGLLWTAIAREPGTKALLLMQSDGAVVEEYRIRRLGHMMAFDAGAYELKR